MTTLTFAQLEGYAIAGGFPATLAPIMAAIAMAESSGNPSAIQQGQPYSSQGWGLWQITPGNSEPGIGTNDALLDPTTNAKAAYAKYKSQGLNAWTTYTGGKYKQFLKSGVDPVAPTGAGNNAAGEVSQGNAESSGNNGETYSSGGGTFQSFLGGVFNDLTNGLFDIPGAIIGTFSDIDHWVGDFYKAAALFFKPSTYVRIGAGLFGTMFVILGIVCLAREAKTS